MHIIFRLAVGGLENGLVNLVNGMPRDRYRHIIVCLKDYTEFRNRISTDDVCVVALNKRDGQDISVYNRLWKLFRAYRPSIVHTRNLSGMEYHLVAAAAGIPVRIHGEHGLDMSELDGSNRKYNLLRKAVRPVVDHYITVSADLSDWLARSVGIRPDRMTRVYNGVDTRLFHPRSGARKPIGPGGFPGEGTIVIGTVGRMEEVKDPLNLVSAFLRLLESRPDARDRLRLAMVGDGSIREKARRLLTDAGADRLAWLPGDRSDIPDVMRGMDLFVLPSRREGLSNTILEAMATGLPVVATRVGGNPELVVDGVTGCLVPPGDPAALSESIRAYLEAPERLIRDGCAARTRAESCFSIDAMVRGYLSVYDTVLKRKSWAA